MPDENSNLKSPAPAGRPSNRRRGRRGGRGRGRGPRPAGEPSPADNSPAADSSAEAEEAGAPVEAAEHHEAEADTSGGFREPHTDAPAEFPSHPTTAEDTHASEPAAEISPAAEVAESRPAPARPREFPQREQREQREPREPREPREQRPQPRPHVPPAQRQWVKPADFRPAESTAIHEAVSHATFIANALKELHDQMDEILELVEVAERQKLADERELDELRRALRRIQPQSRPQPPPRFQPRRDEPRRPQPERQESAPPAESPEPPPAAE